MRTARTGNGYKGKGEKEEKGKGETRHFIFPLPTLYITFYTVHKHYNSYL